MLEILKAWFHTRYLRMIAALGERLTFCRNHSSHLIVAVPYTERMYNMRASSEQVVQALRHWLAAMVASGTRRYLGPAARVNTRPNDITPVLRVWVQPVEVGTHRSLDILASEVRLPSSVMKRRERCPLRRRQSRHSATDQGRGLSQRSAVAYDQPCTGARSAWSW